jgi:2-polyprenyl-3-methyl-5-hydroxy-6-metoxy-1,4-benzoquinol methylase
MNWLGELIQKDVTSNDTVLDLGCGIMSATDGMICKSVLGVDVFEKYLNHIKSDYNTVRLSMNETDRFMDKSYDIVLCLDVLEHLDHELSKHILNECVRIARKKVIIFTPSIHKDNSDAENNAWGLGKCSYQKHISVTDINDLLTLGFKVKDPMDDNSYYGVCEIGS